MARYSINAEGLRSSHKALDFNRIARNAALNAETAAARMRVSQSDFLSRVLQPKNFTLDGAPRVRSDYFDDLAPPFLKKSRRVCRYGSHVVLRGTRYTISSNPTFELRQKLHDLQEDFSEGLTSFSDTSEWHFVFAIADYVKNAAVTFFNALVADEKIGNFKLTNSTYQELRRDAQAVARDACDLYYLILLRLVREADFALRRLLDRGVRTMEAVSGRILNDYRAGSFSSRHIVRPEASHPLIIGSFAARLGTNKSLLPDCVVGLPAGSTELACAVALAYKLFQKTELPVHLLPLSLHSIKHDFDETAGSTAHVSDLITHHRARFRKKKVLVVDDNSSSGRTVDAVVSAIEDQKPLQVKAFVAEADTIRSALRLKDKELKHVAAPSLYTYSTGILPVSKRLSPRFDLKQLNERRRMLTCLNNRYPPNSADPIVTIIGEVYRGMIRNPNPSSEQKKIDVFRKTFLSNFYPAQVLFEDDLYSSVEHAYQKAKFESGALATLTDEHLTIINKKLSPRGVAVDRAHVISFFANEGLDPGTSKVIGNQLRILGYVRDDWDHQKLPIMVYLLLQKFAKPDSYGMLAETGSLHLEEGNDWDDTFWGVCNGRGRNTLGRVLMQIRQRSFEDVCSMKEVALATPILNR